MISNIDGVGQEWGYPKIDEIKNSITHDLTNQKVYFFAIAVQQNRCVKGLNISVMSLFLFDIQ